MLITYRLFGFLYVISGFWCAFQLELASKYLGFAFTLDSGSAEFFAVYGGLQVGLGLAFLLTSYKSVYLEAGLYFSAIVSSGLVFFRLISFFIFGLIESLIVMLVLEVLIASFLWFFWFKAKQSQV